MIMQNDDQLTEEVNTFHKRQNQKGILDLFNR
jgi:hypothetical protein